MKQNISYINDFPFLNGSSKLMDIVFGSVSDHNYPPYNIIKVTEDGTVKYVIELAVAGLSKEDLKVVQKEDHMHPSHNVLVISNSKNSVEPDKHTYICKKIANRSFSRSFYIDKNYEVEDVFIKNGLLTVICAYRPQNANEKEFTVGEK